MLLNLQICSKANSTLVLSLSLRNLLSPSQIKKVEAKGTLRRETHPVIAGRCLVPVPNGNYCERIDCSDIIFARFENAESERM